MLDSPYVRRVAISVFSTCEKFTSINPVVNAPTLVCDDGEILMDSSLILQFIEAAQTHVDSLWSRDPEFLKYERNYPPTGPGV